MNSPLNLEIGSLSVGFDNARGHEHRIQPIVQRAGALLAQRLDRKYGESGLPATARDSRALAGTSVPLNLSRTSDEQAASAIASAWLEAIAMHMEK
jgi:hypothetical protein